MRQALLLACALLWVGLADVAVAAVPRHRPASHSNQAALPDTQLDALRALLRTPDDQVDLATAKITIDRMIDPTINAKATLQQIDNLAEGIRARFPPAATRNAKAELLVTSLSQPGSWNDNRPFRYDLDDPFGKVIQNKLVSTYLTTRKGNCVSMPILMVILGRKLGLDMALATAPEHVLVKFLNERGQWINIEATSFGVKRDASYQQEMDISAKALANGIYLRPLSPRESVVAMMSTLMEFYGQQNNQERRIAVADLALEAAPKDINAMLNKGNAYYRLLRQRYLVKYASSDQIPPSQRPDFAMLAANNERWFDKAEELGWRQPTPAQDATYLENVKRTKAAQQGSH